MEAKELRIGNWIIDYEAEPEETIYYQVEEIQRLSNNKALNQTLGVTYRKGSCWTCDIEPIPLTEEWLLKFGFEKGEDEYNFNGFDLENRNTDLFLSVDKIIKLKDNFGCWYFGAYLRELKHVHQLQNLYFALTNRELKLT
jgi:hypothetical protein